MKKMLLLLAFTSICLFGESQNVNVNVNGQRYDNPQTEDIGGVGTEVFDRGIDDNDRFLIFIENYNDFRVTVKWEARKIANDGTVIMKSGNVVLEPKGKSRSRETLHVGDGRECDVTNLVVRRMAQ